MIEKYTEQKAEVTLSLCSLPSPSLVHAYPLPTLTVWQKEEDFFPSHMIISCVLMGC